MVTPHSFAFYDVCFFFLSPLGLDVGLFFIPLRKWVSSYRSKKNNNPNPSPTGNGFGLYGSGAGGGTRTHTPLRITDFESVSSANSDTPANCRKHYFSTTRKILQQFFCFFIIFLFRFYAFRTPFVPFSRFFRAFSRSFAFF